MIPIAKQSYFDDPYDDFGYEDGESKLKKGSRLKGGKRKHKNRLSFSTRNATSLPKRGDDSRLSRLEKVLDWRRHYAEPGLIEDSYL